MCLTYGNILETSLMLRSSSAGISWIPAQPRRHISPPMQYEPSDSSAVDAEIRSVFWLLFTAWTLSCIRCYRCKQRLVFRSRYIITNICCPQFEETLTPVCLVWWVSVMVVILTDSNNNSGEICWSIWLFKSTAGASKYSSVSGLKSMSNWDVVRGLCTC